MPSLRRRDTILPSTLLKWKQATEDPRKEFLHPENSTEAVHLMLRYGASANARGKENVTPLHIASEFARLGAMKALLAHGADPHAVDDYGWTSLHYAVVSGSQAAVDLIPPDIDRKTAALVTVMGAHTDRLDVFDLIRVVNEGVGGRRLRLDRDTTDI